MMNLIPRPGYRKLCWGLLILATGIAMELGLGLSANMLYLLIFIGSAFIAGNGIEHISDAVKNKKQPGVNTDAVTQVVQTLLQNNQEIYSKIEGLEKGSEVITQALTLIIDRAKLKQ